LGKKLEQLRQKGLSRIYPKDQAFTKGLTLYKTCCFTLNSMVYTAKSQKGGLRSFWKSLILEATFSHKFSKGMKQRLAIARTFLTDSPLLLLDEPTSGLDPDGVSVLVSLIKERVEKGATVLIGTHNPYFARRVCECAMLLSAGRISRKGSLEEVVFQKRVRVSVLSKLNEETLKHALNGRPFKLLDQHQFEFCVKDKEDTAKVVETLVAQKLGVVRVEQAESLEEDFG